MNNNIASKLSYTVNTSTRLGDFNSKVGRKQCYEQCLGKYSKGKRNANGDALIEFAQMNNLLTSNTCFHHPSRHLTTWEGKSPAGKRIFNQIDFILCNSRQRAVLQDARTYTGTRTFSDHRLVMARVKFKPLPPVWNRGKTIRKRKFNTMRLVNDKKMQKLYQTKMEEAAPQLLNVAEARARLTATCSSIRKVATGVVGCTRSRSKLPYATDEVDKLSELQRKLRMDLNSTPNMDRRNELRVQRSRVQKEIRILSRQLALQHLERRIRGV